MTYEINAAGTGYIVTGIGTCTDTEIVIPDMYNGLPVVEIDDWAFCYCDSLTSVVIPDSVTEIGSHAFAACYNLTSVVIPDSVTEIGAWAFNGCSNLTEIYHTRSQSDVWGNLYIDVNNSEFFMAMPYYYSESAPDTEGNFWHYVDGNIVIW